jgi:hypothetical protein
MRHPTVLRNRLLGVGGGNDRDIIRQARLDWRKIPALGRMKGRETLCCGVDIGKPDTDSTSGLSTAPQADGKISSLREFWSSAPSLKWYTPGPWLRVEVEVVP